MLRSNLTQKKTSVSALSLKKKKKKKKGKKKKKIGTNAINNRKKQGKK